MSDVTKKNSESDSCVSRRDLLKTAGYAGAAALVAGSLAGKAEASLSGGKVYPQVKVANIKDLKKGTPLKFDYPIVGRKNLLIDCGCNVEGGMGPQKSIVAYSMFCTHLGCSLELDKDSSMLVCECHQTAFNPKKSGLVLEGPAPSNLPMVNLEIDSKGDIYAVGVSGLIYGMRNNMLDGKEVR